MKLYAVLVSAILLVTILGTGQVLADKTVENRISTEYRPQKPATDMPPTYIDGVSVPYHVLVYAQVVYQGYAVTQAEETTWNGEKAYQLRIDNDSIAHDNNGMYLLYDKKWELIGDKPLYAPLPRDRKSGTTPVEPAPAPATVPEAAEETEPITEDESSQEQENNEDTPSEDENEELDEQANSETDENTETNDRTRNRTNRRT